MELKIYKGFDLKFFNDITDAPLMNTPIQDKKNVLKYNKKTRKQLEIALLGMDEGAVAWITYEEYSLIKNRVDDAIKEDNLKVIVYKNNLFPDYYPIEFDVDPNLTKEIIDTVNGDRNSSPSDECLNFLQV